MFYSCAKFIFFFSSFFLVILNILCGNISLSGAFLLNNIFAFSIGLLFSFTLSILSKSISLGSFLFLISFTFTFWAFIYLLSDFLVFLTLSFVFLFSISFTSVFSNIFMYLSTVGLLNLLIFTKSIFFKLFFLYIS